MPTLYTRLLVDFSLVCGDAPIATVSPSCLQPLRVCLVLHRDAPQSRQHLAFLLWSDSVEKRARTNLRNPLQLMHYALSATFTPTRALQWALHARCALDVDQCEQRAMHPASRARLQEAVKLQFQ